MLGARVFEKHFTLNHAWKGTDHAYSLMPDGMRRFVRDLQRVPGALGDGVKRRLPSEERPLQKMGKKLVAARELPAGHVLAPGDLVAKSPADGGLPPYELDDLLGRTLARPLARRAGRRSGRPRARRSAGRRPRGVTELAEIRFVVFDFDGVFSDNRVWTNDRGEESVACWRGDALGLRRLEEVGVDHSDPLHRGERRRRSAGAEDPDRACSQGVDDKLPVLREEVERRGVSLARPRTSATTSTTPAASRCGRFPVVPADAWPDVVPLAGWCSTRRGGYGCVREFCDALVRKRAAAA